MNPLNQVTSQINLFGAYGRSYRSKAAALADWAAGKDFTVGLGGCYCSVRDLPGMKENSSGVYLYSAEGFVQVWGI